MIRQEVVALKRIVTVMLILCVAVLFAGCVNKPTREVSDSSGGFSSLSGSGSEISFQGSGSAVETGPELKLMAAGSRIMLWPADLQNISAGDDAGDDGETFYILDEVSFEWVPAEFSLEKIGNVEAKTYRDTEMKKFDVFRVSVGEWRDYFLRNGELTVSDPSKQVWSGIYDASIVKAMHTKDHVVLQICDDLYVVEEDGSGSSSGSGSTGEEIRMVSARNVGGFDYETVDKEGVPDLFAWEWICQPVCSPENNTVLYLTSREDDYYSVWSLNLDSGEEKNAGMDTAIRLEGAGSELADNGRWSVVKEGGKIIFSSSAKSFTVDADEAFSVYTGTDMAFLTAGSADGDESPIIFVDLIDGTVKESWFGQVMKIGGWEELLGRVG